MEKIDVFIPAAVSTSVNDEHEVETVSKNYSELHEAAGVENKAFIQFNGKPMISYIIDVLDKAETVQSITIAGQTKESFPIEISKPVYYVEGGETTFKTVTKIIDFYNNWEEPPELVMNVSSDVPLIQPAMIDRMVRAIDLDDGKEFYWNLIIAEDVYRHYPEIHKVPFQLKEANFRFGDLHILSPKVMKGREKTLETVMGNRKSVWGNIKLFGFVNLIKYIFKRISMKDIKKRMESQFNLRAAMMITEFPETCIDLDYAKDLENFERWLSDKPREIPEKEQVIILDEPKELDNYLKSRNYKKGKIPKL